jgi:rfaE bifunctional protein kinase chain/domain
VTTPTALGLLQRFSGMRITVVGDLCLDEYIIGKAQRLSREAPVPVLEWQERLLIPGAACNPALNVQAVGGHASVCGVVGRDDTGSQLRYELEAAGVDTAGLVVDPSRGTTLKTRVLASHLFPQQVVRVDRQDRSPLRPAVRAAVLRHITGAVARADAVLLSDYRSGVIDARLVATVLAAARERAVPVCVDSQGDFAKFRGVQLFRCNREEAEGYLRRKLGSETAIAAAAGALQRRLGVGAVVITRGSEGMSVADAAGRVWHIPVSNPSEVYDVTGAGDTVIALLSLGMAAGGPVETAARIANVAAGEVVRKLGNATLTGEELAAAVLRSGLS